MEPETDDESGQQVVGISIADSGEGQDYQSHVFIGIQRGCDDPVGTETGNVVPYWLDKAGRSHFFEEVYAIVFGNE